MKDKIKIIWVDDEHDHPDQSGFVSDCKEANISFKMFRSKNKALKEIKLYHALYDLFLLDGRIVENEEDSTDQADAKYSRELREEINHILPSYKPILVRTGKIFEEEHEWYYDIFGRENIHQKSEDSQKIIEAIFDCVKNTPRVTLQKKNFLLMDVLEKYFEKESEKIFIDLAITTDAENHEYRYNTLRKLFEFYLRKLCEKDYLPNHLGKENVNIQGSSLFFCGKHTHSEIHGKGYILEEKKAFNKVSQNLITFLSRLFNEKSHTSSEYFTHVKYFQTTSLFECCLSGLIELYVYTFKFYIENISIKAWKIEDLSKPSHKNLR